MAATCGALYFKFPPPPRPPVIVIKSSTIYTIAYLLRIAVFPSKMYLSPWNVVSFENSETLGVSLIANTVHKTVKYSVFYFKSKDC